MAEQYRRTLWLIVLMVLIAAGALALVVARTNGRPDDAAATLASSPSLSSSATGQHSQLGPHARRRNLSLHPEAFNMGRRLGQRFSPGKRDRSLLVGPSR
jgi:hypothetical protein